MFLVLKSTVRVLQKHHYCSAGTLFTKALLDSYKNIISVTCDKEIVRQLHEHCQSYKKFENYPDFLCDSYTLCLLTGNIEDEYKAWYVLAQSFMDSPDDQWLLDNFFSTCLEVAKKDGRETRMLAEGHCNVGLCLQNNRKDLFVCVTPVFTYVITMKKTQINVCGAFYAVSQQWPNCNFLYT